MILEPAEFYEATGTAQLYQSQKFYFTPASVSVEGCGSISYSLIDGLTGDPLLAPEFTLNLDSNTPYFEVLALDSSFADNSPYNVILEISLGVYAEVESNPIFL